MADGGEAATSSLCNLTELAQTMGATRFRVGKREYRLSIVAVSSFVPLRQELCKKEGFYYLLCPSQQAYGPVSPVSIKLNKARSQAHHQFTCGYLI